MYCTLEDLTKAVTEKVLLQLTDDERSGFFVNPTTGAFTQAYSRVVEAIDKADVLIDGYISGRYTLPLPVVPGIIKNVSVNLAICEIYGRKHEAVTPEGISDRYRANIKILERLQSGEVILPGQQKKEKGMILCNKTDEDRMFSDSFLSKY